MKAAGRRELAGGIVEAVLANLADRKGIGDELGGVHSDDPETWKELVESCQDDVDALLQEADL